jgi:hypothetical protein
MQYDSSLLRAQIDLIRKDPSLLSSQGEPTNKFYLNHQPNADNTFNRVPHASSLDCNAVSKYELL